MSKPESILTNAVKAITAFTVTTVLLLMFAQASGVLDPACANGGQTVQVPVTAVVSAKLAGDSDAKFVGPDTLDVKESDLYQITGLDAKALADSNVIAFPEDALRIAVLLNQQGVPTLYVKAVKPGKCVLIGDINVPGKYALIKKEIVVGGTIPNPPLPPAPQPKPGAKLQVMFVIESGELDNLPPKQKQLLNSLTLRKTLTSKGHKFLGTLDKDTAGARTDRAAWFAAAGSVPCLLVAPIEGGDIKAYPLPTDEAAFWKIVEGG